MSTLTITTANGKRTQTYEVTADIDKFDFKFGTGIYELHARGQGPVDEEGERIPVESLTVAHKKTMMREYIDLSLRGISNAGNHRQKQDAARTQADTENAANEFDDD